MAVRVTVYGTADMKQIEKARAELDRLQKSALKNATGFQASMARLSSSASSAGQQMQLIGGSMTRNLTTPLLAMGAGMVWAANGAEQAEIANRKLGSVLDSMGYASATSRVSAYAEELERTIAVDADVVKATQTKLATFGNLTSSVNQAGGAFDRATLAALDLAAAGFGTAEGNAVQLGKALQDPIKGLTSLTKSGVTFTDQQKEQIKALTESGRGFEAQNMILAAIEKQVGGTAAASASSFEKIRLSLMATADEIGLAVLPMVEQFTAILVSDVLPTATRLIQQVTNAFGRLSPQMQTAVVAGIAMTAALGPVVSIAGKLVSGVGAAANGILFMSKQSVAAVGGLRNFATGLTNARAGSSAFATPMMRAGGAIRTAALATKGFIVDLARQTAAMAANAARWIASTAAMIAHKTASLAVSAATKAAALAQWALNVAMTANPIGIVVVAIGALVAALVLLFRNNETVRKAFTAAWQAIKNAAAAAFNWVKSNWPLLLGILTGPIGLAVAAIVKNWDKIKAGAVAVWNGVVSFFKSAAQRIVDFFNGYVSFWRNIGTNIVNGIKNGITGAWSALTSKVSSLASGLLDTAKGVLGIRSPSREFARIGREIPNGMAVGVNSNRAKALNAVKKLAQDAAAVGGDVVTRSYAAMAAAYAQDKNTFRNNDLKVGMEWMGGSSGSSLEAANTKNATAATKAASALNALKGRAGELMNSFGIGEMPGTSSMTAESVLAAAKAQAVAMRNFVANIADLRKSGLAKGVVAALLAAGPAQGGAAAAALAGMTDSQVSEYNQSYRDEQRMAKLAAKMQANGKFAPNVTVAPGAVNVTVEGTNASANEIQVAIEDALQKLVKELRSR
jgi:hypothetical protein